MNTAFALAPEEPRVLRTRGQLYLRQQKLELAVADLSRATAADSNDILSCAFRMQAYDALGNKDLATADRDQILRIDPQDRLGLTKGADGD